MKNENIGSGLKYSRILQLYTKLMNGEIINKADEAERFGKGLRSIQRDIEALRSFFADGKIEKKLIYDPKLGGYYLKTADEHALTHGEIFAVCKILLESRAFCKSDIESMIGKLIFNCIPKSEQHTVGELISDEIYHYAGPRQEKHFIGSMWDIAKAAREHSCIEVLYTRPDGAAIKRTVEPVGIMFSECYFYLTAFIENIDEKSEPKIPDGAFPAIYRIDRIQGFKVLDRHFEIPHNDGLDENEFRRQMRFIYSGGLRRIKFLYKGSDPEAVLDRLPTAKVINRNNDGYIITAEVFGSGADIWVRNHEECALLP